MPVAGAGCARGGDSVPVLVAVPGAGCARGGGRLLVLVPGSGAGAGAGAGGVACICEGVYFRIIFPDSKARGFLLQITMSFLRALSRQVLVLVL